MVIEKTVSKDYIKCEESDTVSSVLGKLAQTKFKSVLVYNGKNFLGVLSRRRMLSIASDPSKTKVSKYLLRVPRLSLQTELNDAAELLLASTVEALPVFDKDKLLGIVKGLDLAKAYLLETVANLSVSEVEIEKPSPLKKTDKMSQALKILLDEKVDHALLFDGRQLEGLISVSDILKYVALPLEGDSYQEREKLSSLLVSDFATMGVQGLHTATRSASVAEALSSMQKLGTRDLIIEENGKVFGLLTARSVIISLLQLEKEVELNVRQSGLSKTSLNDSQVRELKTFCLNESSKFKNKFGQVDSFFFRFKEMKSSGNSHKYSVHLKIAVGSDEIKTEAVAWDLQKAVKACFKNMTSLLKKDAGRRKR